MSDWIDDDYAINYMITQRNYSQVSLTPLKLRCSCPVCGDSSKDPTAARFWYYEYQNTKFVHCYNCDYSSRFDMFLKEYSSDDYQKYQLEKFKENGTSYKKEPNRIKKVEHQKLKIIQKLLHCERLDTLLESHPIVKYVNNRKIPKDAFNRLWFTARWQDLVNSVKPLTYPEPKNEYRLVIPIFNSEGKIESFQGRALKANAKNKYITIKSSDDSTKIYGQDLVDDSKPVFVMEGPIDSLFIKNSIAITGGSLNLESVPFKKQRIWVMDNEPRHPDTIKRMEKLIDSGEKVCFWTKAPWKSKDINDMIKNEGATAEEIEEFILNNSESGLMAKFKITEYSKL